MLALVGVALVALVTPGLLAVNGVRVVTHPWIVRFEYGPAGLAPDRYGLDRAERTSLALVGLESIRPGTRGVELLREARLPDGSPAFRASEIAHMQDVRTLLGRALRVQLVVGLALLAVALALARTRFRAVVPTGLLAGAGLTVAIGVAAVPAILLGFDGLFVRFHHLFFEGDSWLFPLSYTLIRLYPQRFWEDVSGIVAGLTFLQAVVLGVGAWLWLRRARRGVVQA